MAPRAFRVRVGQIMSCCSGPRTGRPPPEGANVGYARATEFLSRHERFQEFIDVDGLVAQMEFLAEDGLDVLNERLLESPEDGLLDIVTEHNVGATLAGRAFRELSYEPKAMQRPVDLVGARGGYRYQLEVKRLAVPELDRRQGKALEEVRRQLQSVIDPVWLGLVMTERFELWHWLLGRSASASGRLCPVARAHGRGGRRQRGLMLATLPRPANSTGA